MDEREPSPQVVNVGSARITAQGASRNSSFADASSIICTTPDQIAPDTSFLLEDHAPGSILADFAFGFEPSVLRLLNTQVPNRGTQTFSFTAFPINGIMNFTYYTADGQLQSCTNACPLAQNSSYQDFYFVNRVGMNSFRLDLSAWYGLGAGLGGIEIFQNDIFAYAVDNFNSKQCDGISNSGASSTNTGPWTVAPSGDSYSQYLTASLPDGTSDDTDVSVVFMPNIQVSGNYSINMWTPGCLADNTCSTRGEINLTGTLASSTSSAARPISGSFYQTNNYMKYDQIYYGYIEAPNGDYRPSITLTPSAGQNRPLTVVAQSLALNLTSASETGPIARGGRNSQSSSSSDGGRINGLYEYNPNQVEINNNFTSSEVDVAGAALDDDALVMSVTLADGTLYAGGRFSSGAFDNIMSIENGNATDLADGGLNGVVNSLYFADGAIFAGGNFSNTRDGGISGLNNVASYTISSRQWQTLGAGVNGIVYDVLPMSINVSSVLENALAVSGHFDQINAFGDNDARPVLNTAIWILSQNNWLQNVQGESISLRGRINAYVEVPDQEPIFSGSIDSQVLSASGVVGLSSSDGDLALQQYPLNFQSSEPSSASKVKRAIPSDDIQGVVTALFYEENGLNLTIVGGRFSALASNGSRISNLAIINGTNEDSVTGLASNSSSDAVILALETSGTTLYVGGSITNGIMFYDLSLAAPYGTQPPGVSGGDSSVRAIALQPSSTNVYVGGSFSRAGSLECAGLCVYDSTLQQWNAPESPLSSDSTVNYLQWPSNNRLILAGDLSINGGRTNLAYYDSSANQYTIPSSDSLPGPISSFTVKDDSYTTAFAAGTSTSNSSAYLAYFDGKSTWTGIDGLGPNTTIQGLQTLGLSSSHDNTDVLSSEQALLVMGQLNLPQYGIVSAALYNGTAFIPIALSTLSDGSPGSIYGAFVQNPNALLNKNDSHLALGFIVLIGLACALGALFLLVVLGILIERIRRRREGYVPAPTGAMMYEKSAGGHVGNISPERLFGGVGGSPPGNSPRI